MKVVIKEVLEVADKMSKANKPYKLTTFKGEDDKLYRDVYGELKVGAELEGEWVTDNYGTKFKLATSGGGGSRNDPERQGSIERQNSLSNAVAYCTAKANLMEQKEALKYLSGKKIVQVATYFKRYNEGKVTCVMNPAEIAKEFGYESEKLPEKQVDEIEDRNDDSARDEVSDSDLNEIPWKEE